MLSTQLGFQQKHRWTGMLIVSLVASLGREMFSLARKTENQLRKRVKNSVSLEEKPNSGGATFFNMY